jgi:RNA polymerase sigma factor (sigma-70 family)
VSAFSPSTDELLWQQLLTGDDAAMAPLLKRMARPLFHYGSKFTPDRELIKDCIQDVLLDVWEQREAVSAYIPARAYLMASLRRKIHRRVVKGAVFSAFASPNDLPFDVTYTVQDRIIEDETARQVARRVQHLLNSLPKRQQEVVYLKFFHNLDREHIAETMGVAPQTVSNLLQLALQKLRQHAAELPLLGALLVALQG